MQRESILVRDLPLAVADAPDAGDAWAKSPVSSLSDAALVEAVAGAIAPPKRDADTSFLTHAPLELAARAGLLPMIASGARDQARRRIARIAAEYAGAGEEVDAVDRRFADERAARRALVDALRAGDAELADAALLFLAPRVPLLDLRQLLAGELAPLLGAAAHAPILLAELPRLEARLAGAAHLLRAPLRQIAKMSSVKISWHERASSAKSAGDDGDALFEALLAPPPVHSGSLYIAPTMLAVEANAYAQERLEEATADLSVGAATRAILRIGALSMLQDDAAHAPYGWSHALTMPQGVLSCADAVDDKRLLVRVAATHALGFRATLGKVRLHNAPPPRPASPALVGVAPIEAAGAAFHADDGRIAEIRTALATRAATHHDAHLAKYTLACFDAAARDKTAARLFLAAAAYLGAWWDAHPGAAFE